MLGSITLQIALYLIPLLVVLTIARHLMVARRRGVASRLTANLMPPPIDFEKLMGDVQQGRDSASGWKPPQLKIEAQAGLHDNPELAGRRMAGIAAVAGADAIFSPSLSEVAKSLPDAFRWFTSEKPEHIDKIFSPELWGGEAVSPEGHPQEFLDAAVEVGIDPVYAARDLYHPDQLWDADHQFETLAGSSEIEGFGDVARAGLVELGSGGELAEHTETDGGESAMEGGVDPRLPVFTIALSGMREGKLLIKGDTDLLTAAKNLTLDVAGTGGGMFLGALIGSALLPGPGTFIGGLIGSIGGRTATEVVKRGPLTKSAKEVRSRYESFLQHADSLAAGMLNEHREYVATKRSEFMQHVDDAKREAHQWIVAEGEKGWPTIWMQRGEARDLLAQTVKKSRLFREDVIGNYRQGSIFRRLALPSAEQLAWIEADRLAKLGEHKLTQMVEGTLDDMSDNLPWEQAARVGVALCLSGFGHEPVRRWLKSANGRIEGEKQSAFRLHVEGQYRKLRVLREQFKQAMAGHLEEQRKMIGEELSPHRETLEVAIQTHEQQLRKLGRAKKADQ